MYLYIIKLKRNKMKNLVSKELRQEILKKTELEESYLDSILEEVEALKTNEYFPLEKHLEGKEDRSHEHLQIMLLLSELMWRGILRMEFIKSCPKCNINEVIHTLDYKCLYCGNTIPKNKIEIEFPKI
jgi:hypothetical protein